VTNSRIEQVLEPLRQRVLETRIGRCEALNRGQLDDHPRDVTSRTPSSRAARDYQQLTEEIISLWPPH
jgi:cellulose biosynthesis protein BcsQ